MALTGLTGIGYQGHDLDTFLEQVRHQGVSVIVDVRLNPVSRKRGFSKRALAAALAEVSVEYVHLPELGNPKDNRAGFAGDEAELAAARDRFAAGLTGESALAALEHLTRLATSQRVSLLCFEADERRCHRDVVAAAISDPGAFGLADVGEAQQA